MSPVRRLGAALERRPSDEGGRRGAMAVAVVLLVAGTALALRGLDGRDLELRLGVLAWAMAVGHAATVVTNAAEFVVAGRLVGQRWGMVAATRIAVLASAANVLPVPGGALVRYRALRGAGAAAGAAVGVNLVVAGVWLAVSLLAAGVLQAGAGEAALGGGAVAAGVVAGTASLVAMVRLDAGRLGAPGVARMLVALAGVELLNVLAVALRLGGAMAALGFTASAADAVAVSVSATLAALLGVFPGGLGARELMAGGIGGLVGTGAAATTLASVVDRVVHLGVLAALATAFGALRPAERASSPDRAVSP